MEIGLLRTFVTVVRLGSFSAADGELGYTQSAVSQQIAALEHDLGVALLHRRPVTATEAGRRLVEHAGPILLRLDAARADVRRLSGAAPAHVDVGASPLADRPRAAEVLADLRAAMPRVTFSLRVAGRVAITSAVAKGGLDLGLVDGVTAMSDPLPLPDAGLLLVTPLSETPVAVAVPPDHPLAGRSQVRLEHLADAAWVDAPDIVTPLPQLRTMARTDGFRASLRYDGTDVRTLLSLVAAGAGLVLLPAPLLEGAKAGAGALRWAGPGHGDPGLVGLPLAAPRLVHRVDLVHASLTDAAAAMVAELRRAAGGRAS